MCCDIRIAADTCRFGLPEVKLGIIPAAGATQTVPRAIGRARALDMMISGEWIDARTAFKYKLVNKVVPANILMTVVEDTARTIVSHDAAAIRQ
jgi:enoyl-CoA hydratase